MEQTDFEWMMVGHSDVVFSATLSGQLDVRAGLPPRVVSQVPEGTDQFNAIAISGYLHAASTSSRT